MELGAEGSEAEVAPNRRALASADATEQKEEEADALASGQASAKQPARPAKHHKRWTKLIAAVRRDSRGVHLLSQSTEAPERPAAAREQRLVRP